MAGMDTLNGSVERITFYNPENGYTVLRLRPHGRQEGMPRSAAGQDGLVTVVGNLPELNPGESLRLQGRWSNHSQHGLQFQSEVCEQTLPATVEGIRRYLGSGLVKGIGTRLAERITAQFGARTLEILETQPELLEGVPDIGPKRARLIRQAWQEQQQIKALMLHLHAHGVSTSLAVKIYKQYGETALKVVQTDPYQLARDIRGVGFKTADKLAQALGLPADHPARLEAGLIYALNDMVEDGHVYSPQAELLQRGAGLLEVEAPALPAALDRLAAQGRITAEILPQAGARGKQVREPGAAYGLGTVKPPATEAVRPPAIYLAALHTCEAGLAEQLQRLSRVLLPRLSDLAPDFISLDVALSPEQHSAVRTALTAPLSVLTGGPGTGKTTALRALIQALDEGRKRYALASPTGRAAKRLAEATGRPASTIHRLLGFKPGEGFKHNPGNPLEVDLLVVDEASMLDLLLAYHLVRALPEGAHLLLVGDADQLPSVGAGDVLRDVIASGVAPVTRLSVIFRQAAGSHIITNAHRINQGELPLFPKDSQDFFLFPADTPEAAADWVQQVVCERIPAKFGLRPPHEIQVLAPMYRGPAGVTALNERLQAALNPPAAHKAEKNLYGQVYRAGDRLMQLQNNYDKEVFNGDLGTLLGVDALEHNLMVEFDGRAVSYDWSEADQLTLAYAVSVHKAQGAEFPAVVLPLVTQHYLMLQRNLLYTAVTRAKKLAVLVGNTKAIGMAVKNDKVTRRWSGLGERLKAG